MATHDKSAAIHETGEAHDVVWLWLVPIGDHRPGFYSHCWIERFVFPGTVHYVERNHSATRIHPELQHVSVGDRVNTGSIGRIVLGNPVTVLELDHALVIGSRAFVSSRCPASTRGCSFANARRGGCGCSRRGGSGSCALWADSWTT